MAIFDTSQTMGYTGKSRLMTHYFSLLNDRQQLSFFKVRVACIWNLFLEMGHSTKCYYCRLWDFKLVDVT